MLSKAWLKRAFIIIILISQASSLFAFKRTAHDTQMRQILFGMPYIISSTEQSKIEILEMALYLALDQYNGNNLYYLDDLRMFGIENIPAPHQIDFSSNQHHQRYTHRGWDYIYSDDRANWNIRKQLLLSSIDKVFNFMPHEMIKRESFAALLYYVHVLGDHSHDGKRTLPDRMRINGSVSGGNMERGDIVWELEYHLDRLFREQQNSRNYRNLQNFLSQHRRRPALPYSQTISDEMYDELKGFANRILQELMTNIPPLLRNEAFFRSSFLLPGL